MKWRLCLGMLLVGAAALAACSGPEIGGARLRRVGFDRLPGWSTDAHAEAFAVFHRSCAKVVRRRARTEYERGLAPVCRRTLNMPVEVSGPEARAFFERNFAPLQIVPKAGSGLATAYYEPEVEGSLEQTERFKVPLYAPPSDLVVWPPGRAPDKAPERVTAARRVGDGLVPHYTRAEIEAGALSGRGLEIAWIESPVDAFFIQIQGSARLRLADGRIVRVGYAGKNGHGYTAVGRVLIEKGELPRQAVSMQSIRDWLASQPPARANALMNENRSYVFFRLIDGLDPALGPIGAQGVPLTSGRSVAVDGRVHVYGSPLWVDTRVPDAAGGPPRPFRRLMVAQDTGGAIVGPARLDLFLGSGAEAGAVAGRVRAPAEAYLLWPR